MKEAQENFFLVWSLVNIHKEALETKKHVTNTVYLEGAVLGVVVYYIAVFDC